MFIKKNVDFEQIFVLTFTKYPPANMKVITVTEAKVVALFKSISVAPIASPSPCHQAQIINFITCCYGILFNQLISKKKNT